MGETFTLRLPSALRERMKRAANDGPYVITETALIRRGIELACRELEALSEAVLKDAQR